MKKISKRNPRLSVTTDTVALSMYHNMLSDFRSVHPHFAVGSRMPCIRDAETRRDLLLPDYRSTLVGRFKAYYQLDSLFKKYRFQDETMTEAELQEVTYKKYADFQQRRSTYGKPCGPGHTSELIPYRAKLVLKEARKICRDILGKLDWNEVYEASRFGRKSSVGCTFAESYLAGKWENPQAFTGTIGTQAFFRDAIKSDAMLTRNFSRKLMCLHEVHPLTIVPKKYNIGRTISPPTLVGLFMSNGLGKVCEERLRHHPTHRLDIKRLQAIHRRVIQKYSVSRSHATLDMSFGSENITSWMLNMLLPREWYRALRCTFVRHLSLGGREIYTESVLPMGNGATFPVETLVFYSIIRATGNLLKVPGRYSAYGDDLIVPRDCYQAVLAIFEDLGVAVNRDKSFSLESFRESCGADFYHGAAVRPFYIPEGIKCDHRQSKRYISWLYKCVNGLSARWTQSELPGTFRMLYAELALATNGKVFLVPPSFPDDSGVKVLDPGVVPFPLPNTWVEPRCSFINGTRAYSFSFLLQVPKKRVVDQTACYLWDWLRSSKEKQLLPMEWRLQDKVNNLVNPAMFRPIDDWKTLVLVDHLRFMDLAAGRQLTYKRHIHHVSFRDKNGRPVTVKRVKWVALVPSKSEFTFEARTVAFQKPTVTEGQDTIISDWI